MLAGGLVALVAELGWFERQARERGLDLAAPHHPTTASYRDLLDELGEAPYGVALLGLWAMERAYLDAWSSAAPGHPPYREAVERWSAPGFAAYVRALEEAADAARDPAEDQQAEAAFLRVAALEQDFWAVGG